MMSKVEKLKKKPVIKLPRPKNKNLKAFEVSSDSEDDDFQVPRPNTIKCPELASTKTKVSKNTKKDKPTEGNLQILISSSKQIIEGKHDQQQEQIKENNNKGQTVKTSRRRKKGNLADLPLYLSSENDKKAEVEERLGRILDENDMLSKSEEFYVRDKPSGLLRLPHRLMKYNAHSTPLWSISKDPADLNAQLPSLLSTSTARIEQPPTSFLEKSPSKNNMFLNMSPKSVSNTENFHQNIHTPQAQLCHDLLRVFVNKEATDLTIYGKEEKPIKAHKLIILARCRKLYSEIVQETASKGRVRDIISLTCFSHVAVKAFIKFLYCGKLKILPEQDFQDVAELGSKYGIRLTDDTPSSSKKSVIPNVSHSLTTTSSDNVQILKTHVVKNENLSFLCSTPKPKSFQESHNLDFKGEYNQNRSSRAYLSMDLFMDEEIKSPRVVTTENDADSGDIFILGKSIATPCKSPNCTATEFQDHEFLDENGRSRDMFEDEDIYDLNMAYEEKNSDTNHEFEDDNCKIIIDDELMTQVGSEYRVVLSPKPYKRSTSSSPNMTSYPSSNLLTASQVAKYIDYMPPIQDLEGSQAIKKHKLDFDIADSTDPFGNVEASKTFKKLKTNCNEISYRKNEFSNTIGSSSHDYFTTQEFPKNPPLPVHSPQSLNFHYPYVAFQQNPCDEIIQNSEDPFGNDGDSCFLNLPSVLATPTLSHPPPRCSPVPSSLLSPVSSRHNSDKTTQNSELNDLNEKQTCNKRRGNGRKKQAKRASSQEPTPTRNNEKSNPVRLAAAAYQKKKGNVMDYSTIDTPILKKELKRYGLKPLPRSKAKLILRHIDEETSKQKGNSY